MEADHSSSQRYQSEQHRHYPNPSSSITTETPAVVPVGPGVQSFMTADSSYDSLNRTQLSAFNDLPSSQDELPVRCLDCRKIFSSQYVLDNHVCKKATSHKCNLCSKTFTRRYNLKIHVQKHLGHFPHRCIICGNGFTKRNALSKHMLNHGVKRTTKLRPQCDICFRVFTRRYTLRLHRAKHMENGQWKCPFCFALFWNSVTFKAHVNKHANEDVTQTQLVAHSISDGAEMLPENFVPSIADNEQREMASSSALTDLEQSITLTVRSPSQADDCKDGIDSIKIKDSISNLDSHPSSRNFENGDAKLLEKGNGVKFSEGIEEVHQRINKEAYEEGQKGAVTDFIENMSVERSAHPSQGKDRCLYMSNYNKADLLLRKMSSVINEEEFTTTRTHTLRAEPQISESKPFNLEDKNLSEPERNKSFLNSRNSGHPPELDASSTEVVSCTQSLGTPPLQTQTHSRETLNVMPSHHLAQSQFDMSTTAAPSVSQVLRPVSVHSSRSPHSSEIRPSWRCTHCGTSFEDSLMYVIHMGCHSNSDPFACNICGHVSANRVDFMLHFVQGQH